MTTVLACVSAAGDVLPTMILHKGKKMWDHFFGDRAYPNTSYNVSEKGWMTEEVFYKWFEQVFVVNGTTRPAIFIYGGHLSHVSSSF